MSIEEEKKGIGALVEEVKKLFVLQKQYAMLVFVEKFAVLLSAMVLFLVVLCLALMGVFYLLTALHLWLSTVVGETASALILAGVIVICILLIICCKETLIKRPILKFVARLLLAPSSKEEK